MSHDAPQPTGRLSDHLGDAVYGALDGTVTTFAVIAGSIGAHLDTNIILILGIANLLADGFSMATGSYLSERTQSLQHQQKLKDTLDEIDQDHHRVNQDLKNMYRTKGFTHSDLARSIAIIKQNKQVFAQEILSYRGIDLSVNSPLLASLVTFVSFVIVGSMPLLPIILMPEINFVYNLIFVAAVLFLVGSLRSRFSAISWWKGGLEIMLAGVVASLIAFFIGDFLTATLT